MPRRIVQRYTVITAASATQLTAALNVSEFRNVVITVGMTGPVNQKIFVKGAIGGSPPNFAASRSRTNQWDYVEVVDLQDGTAIDGDTGIQFTTTDVRFFEVNENVMDWIALNVTAVVTAGLTNAQVALGTNE